MCVRNEAFSIIIDLPSGVGVAIAPVMKGMARAAWVSRVNFILIEVE
jgi:hypothetical protein